MYVKSTQSLTNHARRVVSNELKPSAEHITVATFNLRITFGRPELQDNPNLVWEYGSPVPGILTTNWHPAVKQRLLDLVGPAEFTLERMLNI